MPAFPPRLTALTDDVATVPVPGRVTYVVETVSDAVHRIGDECVIPDELLRSAVEIEQIRRQYERLLLLSPLWDRA